MRRIAIRSLLLSVFMLAMSAASFAQVGFSITIAPPVLPVYDQPVCPGDGYIWTPGYWAWDPDAGDYYWVPGTWVLSPEVGFLWTPPWWGWANGFYVWHAGYWGPHVGFYGGINYGFGYFGVGFVGGRWDGGHFFYNRAVANINVNVIHNVYETKVDIRNESHVSFNGGRGGIEARPTREEEEAEHDRHIAAAGDQLRHEQTARSNPQFRYKSNGGKPPVTASSRPGEFGARGATAGHVKELPPVEHVTPQRTGNAKQDQRYQKQSDDLAAKQEKERQNLQAKQDKEHQQNDKQHATDERKQQTEQRHQQQTQQLQQSHEQQRQQLQSRQAASAGRKK